MLTWITILAEWTRRPHSPLPLWRMSLGKFAALVHSLKEPCALKSAQFHPDCLRGIQYLFAVKVYKNVGLHASFKRKDYLEQGAAKTALQPYFEGGFKDAV